MKVGGGARGWPNDDVARPTRRTFGLAVAAGVITGPQFAAAAADDRGVVVDVVGPTTLRLEDGRAIRLAELVANDPVAAKALAARLAGGEITIRPLGPTDRTGRVPAVVTAIRDARSIQEELVDAGLARVLPERDGTLAAALLGLEEAARDRRRGAWGDGRFQVLAAVPPPPVAGFAIVRGRPVRTGRSDRFHYVDFGRHYRASFSVRVRRRDARDWKLAPLLDAIVDRPVDARGLVFPDGGPMMEIDHPLQLRILD
ncbi:MAG: thermonuclease family protein [Pseudomonadota bacterium]